jgi:2-keto-4-pentenoate hydratase
MALQLEHLREALASGMPRRGWKVGINVPEMQERLGLPHPGVGWLDGRRVTPTDTAIEAPSDARLHVEPEVAIRLSHAVPAECGAATARDCIAGVHPALEVVDYARPSSGLDDVVAHCMFHHATVLGAQAKLAALPDLGRTLPTLRVAGRAFDPPRNDLVPSDLAELVAFVAAFLAEFDLSLESGDLILSGSYTARAAPIAAGETASA